MPKKGHKFASAARMAYYESRRGPRPDQWVTGPDPHRHRQHRAYLLLRVRCRHRKEEFLLTSDEFAGLWSREQWAKRGLQSHQLVLGRKDPRRPWQLDNVEVRTCLANQQHYRDFKRRHNKPNSHRYSGREIDADNKKEQDI